MAGLADSWRVVAEPGAGGQAGMCDPDRNPPPGPVPCLVLRDVAERVLAAQLLRDLLVDLRQLRHGARKEGAAASLLRQLLEDELGLPEIASSAALLQPDRVDRRVR